MNPVLFEFVFYSFFFLFFFCCCIHSHHSHGSVLPVAHSVVAGHANTMLHHRKRRVSAVFIFKLHNNISLGGPEIGNFLTHLADS